jgi:hypothetical protein
MALPFPVMSFRAKEELLLKCCEEAVPGRGVQLREVKTINWYQ